MGRLTQVRPRIGAVKPRITSAGAGPDRLARRDATVAWRKWYKTAEWRALRWQVLTEAKFICARCGWFGGAEPHLLVGDHVHPHRGERARFFDRCNVQCLCKGCHDGAKQREERAHAYRVD